MFSVGRERGALGKIGLSGNFRVEIYSGGGWEDEFAGEYILLLLYEISI